jgi:hypothetical protein
MFRSFLVICWFLLLPLSGLGDNPCCFDDGSCAEVYDSSSCKESGGETIYEWAATCENTVCLGGHCCLPDGSYERLTAVECQDELGGVFYTAADGFEHGICDCDHSCGACYMCDWNGIIFQVSAQCHRGTKEQCNHGFSGDYGGRRLTSNCIEEEEEEGGYVDAIPSYYAYAEFRLGEECERYGLSCHDGLTSSAPVETITDPLPPCTEPPSSQDPSKPIPDPDPVFDASKNFLQVPKDLVVAMAFWLVWIFF